MKIKPAQTHGPLKRVKSRQVKVAGVSLTFKRHLTYTPFFKAFLKKYPGAIQAFLQARKIMLSNNPSPHQLRLPIGNRKITVKKIFRRGNVHAHLYKVILGGKTFFVKEQKEGSNKNRFDPFFDLAERQITQLKRAQKRIQRVVKKNPALSNGITFEVANYHLAWTEGHNSFLVTDFYNGTIMEDLSQHAPKSREIRGQAQKILANLSNSFSDLNLSNTMWLPREKKIVIFDLR